MNYTLKTPATVDPVDLALAKVQCRINDSVSDEDAVLTAYIKAAAAWVRDYTGRPLTRETWQASLPDFPTRTWLPYAAPLGAVTFVKYYDTSNVLQTLSTSVYTVASFSEPACLGLVDAQVWPSVFTRDDAVQIEYTVGATDPADVPPAMQQAVLLLVAHWYANREDSVSTGAVPKSIPMGVEALCAPHRLFLRSPQWETR